MDRAAAVRIPRSGRRDAICYAKLLRRVEPDSRTGFDFFGTLLRPGSQIARSELRPAPDYPERPLLLECAGSDGSGWGHRRSPSVYILWVYDRASSAWVEMVRTTAPAWEWTERLGPLAQALLADTAPRMPPGRASEVAGHILHYTDFELDTLPAGERTAALAILHDELAWRSVGARV
jgi:hypothetical protein